MQMPKIKTPLTHSSRKCSWATAPDSGIRSGLDGACRRQSSSEQLLVSVGCSTCAGASSAALVSGALWPVGCRGVIADGRRRNCKQHSESVRGLANKKSETVVLWLQDCLD